MQISQRSDKNPKTSPWKLLLAIFVAGSIAPLVTLSGRIGDLPPEAYLVFYRQFFFDDYIHAVAMLAALAAVFMLAPLRNWISPLADRIGARPLRTCGTAFALLAIASHFIYLKHPLSMDEYAPLLQAAAFAHGSLTANYPPNLLDLIVPPFFQGWFLLVNHTTGQVMSAYWPGLAMLLAPFAALHLESCLNPALSALALWLIGDLAFQASGAPKSRGWAMLAALASPQFTVNAISFYAMPGLLALNLLFLWLFFRPGWRNTAAAGLVGSFALVMVNPVPHALMAAPCILWLLADRSRWSRLVPLGLGYLPLALLLGIGWPLLTSSMGMRLDGADPVAADTGFVGEWISRVNQIFSLPSFDLLRLRWYSLWKVWIWASPGLLALPFLVRTQSPILRLLVIAFLLTFAFYFLVPYDQGYGWGYRYIHPAWGLLPIGGGIWLAASRGRSRTIATAVIAAGLLATPVFFWQTQSTIARSLAQRLAPPREGSWIVFIAIRPEHHSQDLVQNFPGRERVLFLVSQGAEADRSFMKAAAPFAVEMAHDHRGSMWKLPDAEPAGSAATSPK